MNAKKAKALRRRAKELTSHAPQESYHPDRIKDKLGNDKGQKTRLLGECTKGAYRALKSGRFNVVHHEV